MGTIPRTPGATTTSMELPNRALSEAASVSPERLAWLIDKEAKEIINVWKRWEAEEDLTGNRSSPCKMTGAFLDRFSLLSGMYMSQRHFRSEGGELSRMKDVLELHLNRCGEDSKKALA